MPYLESGPDRFTRLAVPAKTSLRPAPGCVQCGSSLEGAAALTGKCFNCAIEPSEDDDPFEELED